jgi:hypothetical protein
MIENLTALKLFLRVAATRSFSKAGRELGHSLSASTKAARRCACGPGSQQRAFSPNSP